MAITILAHALTSQPHKMKAEMISLFYRTMTNHLIVQQKIVISKHDTTDDLKKYSSILIVTAVAALIVVSCSSENNMLNNSGTQFDVKYEVQINSPGAVKFTHKNSNGDEIVDNRVTTDMLGVLT